MANSFYHNYAHLLLGLNSASHTLPDWDADTFKVHLLDAADHTTSLSADVDEADITDSGIVATATLAGISIATGVLDCNNPVFTSVTGDESEELVFWQDTSTDTTSPLCLRIDTASSGLPITPNGGNITVEVNASGLFKLVA